MDATALATALAALLTAAFNLWMVFEMRAQKVVATKPLLKILSRRGNWCVVEENWDPPAYSPENGPANWTWTWDERAFVISIENFGKESAVDITADFFVDRQEINDCYEALGKMVREPLRTRYLCKTVSTENFVEAYGDSTQSQFIDALRPNQNSQPRTMEIPGPLIGLFEEYFYYRSKHPSGPRCPKCRVEINYFDIQGGAYTQHFLLAISLPYGHGSNGKMEYEFEVRASEVKQYA